MCDEGFCKENSKIEMQLILSFGNDSSFFSLVLQYPICSINFEKLTEFDRNTFKVTISVSISSKCSDFYHAVRSKWTSSLQQLFQAGHYRRCSCFVFLLSIMALK